MRYLGVIFDLDGVICHTDHYHYQAWKRIADDLGIPFDETINHRLRGVSRMASLEIILKHYQGSLAEEEKCVLAERKNSFYQQLLQEMSPKDLSPEVKNTLDQIKSNGIKIAIGSSSRNAKFILSQLGLENYFDGIADGNDISRSKPDPEVFLKASDDLKLAPKECLVVEDAKAGIEAALAGGMDCAAIGDATQYHLATYHLKHLPDLLQFVLGDK